MSTSSIASRLELLQHAKQVRAGSLDVGYIDMGPSYGPPVILLHGWPYDIHSYMAVAPALASRGCRVIVPHLRGHGTTLLIDPEAPRSGQQGAIGVDVIDLMDALGIEKALLAGFDWGGRAACVVAALWPDRCSGLVSVNGYLIQDIASSGRPLPAKMEAAFWYQYYFLTRRGCEALTTSRRDIARVMWERNSPSWRFGDETFENSARSFDNRDYVDVVAHSYRHRLGHAAGLLQYEAVERQLAARPLITVPTVTLDGAADGVVQPTDGRSTAALFVGFRDHRVVPNAGHNLPQEAPGAFVDAIVTLLARGGVAF